MEYKRCKKYVWMFFGWMIGYFGAEYIDRKIDRYEMVRYERLRGELVERIVSRIDNNVEVEVLFYEEEYMDWDEIKGIDFEKLKREMREREAKGIEYPWSRNDHFNEEDELKVDEKGWSHLVQAAKKVGGVIGAWALWNELDDVKDKYKNAETPPPSKPKMKEKQPDPVITIGSEEDKIIVRHTDSYFPRVVWVQVKMEPVQFDKDCKMTVRGGKKEGQEDNAKKENNEKKKDKGNKEKDISIYDKKNTSGYCKGVRFKYLKAEMESVGRERAMFKSDTFDEKNEFKIKEDFVKHGAVKEFSTVSESFIVDDQGGDKYIINKQLVSGKPLMPFGGKFSNDPAECEQVYFTLHTTGILIKNRKDAGFSDVQFVDRAKARSVEDEIRSGFVKFTMYYLHKKRDEVKDVENDRENVSSIEYKSYRFKIIGDGVIEIEFRKDSYEEKMFYTGSELVY